MKLFRTFILLLLCVMLPLSGLAATGLTGDCPMQQSMSGHDDSSMSSNMSGCDMMKSSKAGKAKGIFCKVTAQCQFASIYFPASPATVSHPMAISNKVAFHYAESFTGREPGGLWRPPRAI